MSTDFVEANLVDAAVGSAAWALGAAALAWATVAGARAAHRWSSRARSRRLLGRLELRPNALLTRWPIAFVGGARSPFWSEDHWGFAPRFLAEHGFECAALDLPWTAPAARARALRTALEESSGAFHLVFDGGAAALAEEAASWHLPQIASVTIARSPARCSGRASAFDLRPPSVNNVYQLEMPPPSRRLAAIEGRVLRAALAAHRSWAAAVAMFDRARGRSPAFEAPRPEEIASYDESLRLERRLLAHAISLAESECECFD